MTARGEVIVDCTNPIWWRRLFGELLGTFLLVLVSVGPGVVNQRTGAEAVSRTAAVVAPGLMLSSIILFMGAVSGAHLNPSVTLAFALRRDFPWQRVPGYLVAQFAGAVAAGGLLAGTLGGHGTAGLTVPGPGIGAPLALLWELVLTVGLISTVLGTASCAQNVGPLAALAVGGYLALAGLWASPLTGASMNVARSLGPALVYGQPRAWWAYLVGPLLAVPVAVGAAALLRGPGGGGISRRIAQGTVRR
ncbi:MIP/aquaporin family protein [Micromonospora narathiwatensis]|uniref:Aquaporin Z n=1 Tax=Micromonospora narathiwatensis TaxID=299146 RepID=A0A1A8Z248_9ACTN|nr:aquaporin [Micromonospora narathiwatensis]SBT37955.1 aquaporin Z [Micromonospora narathiwatensis]